MPKKRGTISLATSRIPGCENEIPNLKSIPFCTSAGTCIKNCNAPPTSTPTASDTAGSLKYGHTSAVENAMIAMFRKTEVAAGNPNT